MLYGALLGRSTKSATRPRLISERVISASGARSLLFGPALGHRRRRCIPLALKRLERAGRINARRSPDERDSPARVSAALSEGTISSTLRSWEQQDSRDDVFGHTFSGGPAHIVWVKREFETIRQNNARDDAVPLLKGARRRPLADSLGRHRAQDQAPGTTCL